MSKLNRIAAATAVILGLAASADAAVIAGWDFSQYESGGGALATDGNSSLANTLSANYSNLDPTFNAGTESAQYGQMYVNGQFGSSNVTSVFGGSLLPIAGSLSSNLNAITPNPFNSFTVLAFEGQLFTEDLRMKAFAPTSLVFAADAGAGKTVSNWSLSFATQMESGSGNVVVEFSSDGTTFASLGTLNLTTTDATQTVALSGVSSQRAFVRLTFSSLATFDNVALSGTIGNVVPEPMTASLLAAGLGGLALLGRRRRA
jgi:hypothetical protein